MPCISNADGSVIVCGLPGYISKQDIKEYYDGTAPYCVHCGKFCRGGGIISGHWPYEPGYREGHVKCLARVDKGRCKCERCVRDKNDAERKERRRVKQNTAARRRYAKRHEKTQQQEKSHDETRAPDPGSTQE